MNILLDISVVLDVFLDRIPWVSEATAVLEANEEARITARLSGASLPTIYYLVRRHADRTKAHAVVTECLAWFRIVPVGRKALEYARDLPGTDFEDNLQIACAVQAHLDAIVTRNPKDFAGSPITILTPAELLAKLPKAHDA